MPTPAVKRQTLYPNLMLAGTDEAEQRRLQRAAKDGKITRIAKGVYVNAIDPPDLAPDTLGPVGQLVQRNWQAIIGYLFPGAVVSHLSALCGGITPSDEVTLTHPTRFNVIMALRGLTVVLLRGPGQLPGDLAMGDTGLYWASRARMLLENLKKSHGARPRTAGKTGVEEKLVSILNASGEEALNRVRDEARMLAEPLNAAKNFATLDGLVGALLGTYAKGVLATRAGKLVVSGTPADEERLYRFNVLADYLRATPVPDFPDIASQDPAKSNFAFLESYFSNYVEGTRFSIEEAEEIVMRGKIMPDRPKDSHDILGVFNLALHPQYRSNLPAPNDILTGLCERHRLMLERRPEAVPGEFKEAINYAGATQFVSPGFVRGTLLEGAKVAMGVPERLARAIFYAFLVSEVHPFNDGNGRLSRLLMNAELSRQGRCRVIVPTLFHEQYVDAQRALTRGNNPEPLVRAISRIAEWTALFDYKDRQQMIGAMKAANAFQEEPKAYRLLAPDGSVFA